MLLNIPRDDPKRGGWKKDGEVWRVSAGASPNRPTAPPFFLRQNALVSVSPLIRNRFLVDHTRQVTVRPARAFRVGPHHLTESCSVTTPPPLPASAPPPPLPPAPPQGNAAPEGNVVPEGNVAPYPEFVLTPQLPVREKFGVHWAALLAVVPFAAIRWIASGPLAEARGLADAEAMGFRIGSVLWGLVFACGIAWGAFMVFGRVRAVATATFIAVYGLFTFAAMGSALIAVGPSRAAAVTTPTGQKSPVSGSIASRAPSPAPTSADLSQAPPRDAFDRATATVRAAQAKTSEPTRRWAASGAFNMTGVDTVEKLDERIEILEALGRATREARHAGDAVLQQLRGDLFATGAGPVQQELWAAQWAAEANLDDDRQVALAIEKFLAAGRVQLKLLRQEWGKWRLDPESDRIKFDDPAAQDRFDRQARHVGSAQLDLAEAVRKAKANAGK